LAFSALKNSVNNCEKAIPYQTKVKLAEESGIPLIVSPLGMYEMYGRLYQAGLVPVRRLHQKQVMPG